MKNNDINLILDDLRSEFIIIGLTGALGSGCTETAKFLSDKKSFGKIDNILNCGNKNEFDLEYRKLQRLQYFYTNKKWEKFIHIRVSDILFLLYLNTTNDIDDMEAILRSGRNDTNQYAKMKSLSKKFIDVIKDYNNDSHNKMSCILYKTNKFLEKNIDKSSEQYTKLFQGIGECIRTSGSVFSNSSNLVKKLKLDGYEKLSIFIIPEIVRRVIKLIRKENENTERKDFFVIDALRNIYEIEFFRNRYQSFYLFSIMANEVTRDNRILNLFKFNKKELNTIKGVEKKNSGIEFQAINACIGKGDVFINNNVDSTSKNELYLQLIKYIALIRKPGLFTPSDDERYMQVAFTARYNSGCISRQVGAVVVGKDGYMRGFGWNDTPEKHIPCLYRTPNQLLTCSSNMIFSEYERSNDFYGYIYNKFVQNKDKNNIKFLPFCFKDHQSQIELEKEVHKIKEKVKDIDETKIKVILEEAKFKNPTRERALHAEENAFLQISKSGGQTVIDGTLYSTDSPCQLCAKKTMQLKIKRVVYIDAYPDISIEHTLKAGVQSDWPQFDMFSGVIGSAYFKLFVPIIGRKDEMKFLSN
ncbi:MAG: deaminase [Campylobacterota bacterium]